MKKQNNRPDSPYKNRVQRGLSQQRGKPSSVNGKTDDGLTNLITIDTSEINLSLAKNSEKQAVTVKGRVALGEI